MSPPPLPPRSTALTHCPVCQGLLDYNREVCRECGWSAVGARPQRQEGQARETGRRYIYMVGDQVDLHQEIEGLMHGFIKTEMLDMRIMDAPPERLERNDLVLTGKVVNCDHGSQLMRLFLRFITLFGPGSSKLEVEATAETAHGEKRVDAKTRQHMGFFGGTNDGLMKINVKVVANAIATGAVRFLTDRWFLNSHAYTCASWALGMGILTIIPLAGIPCGLIGLGLGIPALVAIQTRDLPTGKIRCCIGLALCFFGLIGQCFLIAAMAMDKI